MAQLLSSVIILVAVAFAPVASADTASSANDKHGMYIVVLKSAEDLAREESPGQASPAHGEPDFKKLGGALHKSWGTRRTVTLPDAIVEKLRAHPAVKYIQRLRTPDTAELPPPTAPQSIMRLESAALKPEVDWSPPTWYSGEYLYDGSGNIKKIGTGNTYVYDSAGRLVYGTVNDPAVGEMYAYDSFGNLVEKKKIGAAQATPIPIELSTNRLQGYEYDLAGNLTQNGSERYIYDSFNMMRYRTAYPATNEFHIYTADDERIGTKPDTGAWIWTIRDFDGKVIRTYEGAGDSPYDAWLWVEDHFYRDGQLAAAERVTEEGGLRQFHLDHLGTPRLITKANRVKLALHDYYPFGEEVTSFRQEILDFGHDRPERMHFTGHERDFNGGAGEENTNQLDYMHARYYSPSNARLLSVDPLITTSAAHVPQSWNRYAYVHNKPVIFVDPFGLYPCNVKGSDGKDHPGECIDVIAKAPRFSLFRDAFAVPYLRVWFDRREDQSRSTAKPPNREQCQDLKDVLAREAALGTTMTANMSSNTWGDRHTIAFFNNDFNGPNEQTRNVRLSNGDEIDVDWYTDVRSFGTAFPHLFYALGKGGVWRPSGGTSGSPWADPGERTAVRYVAQRRGYADIFTPAYMESNCK